MHAEAAKKAFAAASILFFIGNVVAWALLASDTPGFLDTSTAVLLTRRNIELDEHLKLKKELESAGWTACSLTLVVSGGCYFIFSSLALPALHNGHKSGLPASQHLTQLARAAKTIIVAGGASVIVLYLSVAFGWAPYLVILSDDESKYSFPTQSAITALMEAGTRPYEIIGVPITVFINQYLFDVAYVSLLHAILQDSALLARSRLSANSIAVITVVNSSLVFGTGGLGPFMRPHGWNTQAVVFVAGAVILVGSCSFNLFILHKASKAELREAERCRKACGEKFDRDSKWVDRTARSRAMVTMYALVSFITLFQFMQGVFFVYETTFDHDVWGKYTLSTTILLTSLRAIGTPTALLLVFTTTRAHAESFFNNLSTQHEEHQRSEFQKLIVRYVCHEVRVPLNSLSLGMELLADGVGMSTSESEGGAVSMADPDRASHSVHEIVLSPQDVMEQRRTLVEMSSGISTMRRILNDVLQVQALEQGRIALVYETFDPMELITNVERTFGKEARKKGVRLEGRVSFGPTVSQGVRVRGDKSRLLQVCANFVSNALKFTPEGRSITALVSVGVSASVSGSAVHTHPSVDTVEVGEEGMLFAGDASTVDNDGAGAGNEEVVRLEYSLTDEGVGIQRSDIPKLFKPFHQLESGAKFKQHSTGLGLSICKGIVDMHGGKIRVQSRGINHGATFSFSLLLGVVKPESSIGDVVRKLTRVHPERKEDEAPPRPTVARGRRPRFNLAGPGTYVSASSVGSEGLDMGALEPAEASSSHASAIEIPTVRAGTLPKIPGRSVSTPTSLALSGSVVQGSSFGGPVTPTATLPKRSAIVPQAVAMNSRAVCLVVDDVSGNRMLLQRLLIRMGHTVFSANNGRVGVDKALEILDSPSPPTDRLLVLMDGNMPVLDGVSATKELLARADPGRVVVVAVTGNAHPADRAAFMDAGAVEVVAKPVSAAKLRSIIAKYQRANDTADFLDTSSPAGRYVPTRAAAMSEASDSDSSDEEHVMNLEAVIHPLSRSGDRG